MQQATLMHLSALTYPPVLSFSLSCLVLLKGSRVLLDQNVNGLLKLTPPCRCLRAKHPRIDRRIIQFKNIARGLMPPLLTLIDRPLHTLPSATHCSETSATVGTCRACP